AADGKTIADLKLEDLAVPPAAASLEHDQLILFARIAASSPHYRIASFDVSTGSSGWSVGPMLQPLLTDRMLRSSPNVVPFVETVQRLDPSNESASSMGSLWMIDKVTGSRLGPPIDLVVRQPRTGAVLDVLLLPGRAYITTYNGCYLVGPASDTKDSED